MEMSVLEGQTFTKVARQGERIVFEQDGKPVYELAHNQECREYVWIEDITGDLEDLQATPILEAYRSTNNDDPPHPSIEEDWDDSYTWTFFRIRTIKGTVTIRFFGSSNGYYSEDADLYKAGEVW